MQSAELACCRVNCELNFGDQVEGRLQNGAQHLTATVAHAEEGSDGQSFQLLNSL